MNKTSWPYNSRQLLSIQNYIISYLDGQLLVELGPAVAENDLAKGTMADVLKRVFIPK